MLAEAHPGGKFGGVAAVGVFNHILALGDHVLQKGRVWRRHEQRFVPGVSFNPRFGHVQITRRVPLGDQSIQTNSHAASSVPRNKPKGKAGHSPIEVVGGLCLPLRDNLKVNMF
jgi:hypothetical protein